MKRSNVTYGQLDKVLKGLGFTCRLIEEPPPARDYQHEETGAGLLLPALPLKDRAYAYHVLAARTILDNFGIVAPEVFDAEFQKAV